MFYFQELTRKLWAIAFCSSILTFVTQSAYADLGPRTQQVGSGTAGWKPAATTPKAPQRSDRPAVEPPPVPPAATAPVSPAATLPAGSKIVPELELNAASGLEITTLGSTKKLNNADNGPSPDSTPGSTTAPTASSKAAPDIPVSVGDPARLSSNPAVINPTHSKSFVVQASAEQEVAPPPAPTLTTGSQPDRLPAPTAPQKSMPHLAPTRMTKDHATTGGKPAKPVTVEEVTQEFNLESLPKSITRVRLGDQPTPNPNPSSTEAGSAEELPPAANRVLEMIQFDDVTLAEAMRLFSEQSGLNVITSTEAGKTKVNVFLRNVTPLDALEAIVKANGLFYRTESGSGIVRIATSKEYEKDLSSFREEQTRVFTLLYPNPIAVAQVIQQVFGNRVQMSRADADVDDLVDLSRRFNRFDMVDGRSLGLGSPNNNGNSFGAGNAFQAGGRGGLQNGLAAGLGGGLGGNFNGGALGGAFAGIPGAAGFGLPGMNGNYPVPQSMQNLSRQREHAGLNNLSADEIQQLENQVARQGQLDDQTQADLLQRRDATIYISTIRRNNQIIVRTGDSRSMEQIAQLISQLDVPTPTVLLEVKVLRVVLANGFNSAFEYFGGSGNASGALSDGSLNPAFPGASTVARNLGSGLGVAGGVPGSLTFQMVDDKFKVRMQLLESKNCVTALATPLILTANNEVSRIFVGDTLPFTVGFTPSQVLSSVSAVNGAVAATPITELRDVGQSLLITPNINADRTVTLRVIEENSERVVSGSSIPVPATSGTGVTNVNVDTVRRRTISGTIVAQDGMAVALGGLIEEQLSDARDQVPVLGNIPGLGLLFRRQATGRSRSELVVIVRPYVFNTPTESAATSEMLLGEMSTHPGGQDALNASNALPCRVTRSEAESSQRARLLQLHNRSLTAY